MDGLGGNSTSCHPAWTSPELLLSEGLGAPQPALAGPPAATCQLGCPQGGGPFKTPIKEMLPTSSTPANLPSPHDP